jgi:hypothetical protein
MLDKARPSRQPEARGDRERIAPTADRRQEIAARDGRDGQRRRLMEG